MVPGAIFDGLLNKIKFKNFNMVYKTTYMFSIILIAIEALYTLAIYIFPIQLLPTVVFNPFLAGAYIFLPFFSYLSYKSSKEVTDVGKMKFLAKSFIILDFTLFFLISKLSMIYFLDFIKLSGVPLAALNASTVRNALIPASILFSLWTCVIFMNKFIPFYTSTDVQRGVKNDFAVKVYAPPKHENDFSFYTQICLNADTLKPVLVGEGKRMEGTLIQGATGTGKTSTVMLPMSAMDLERKYLIRELGKEIAFKCLKNGIAKVTVPISNEELNNNFSLRFLAPVDKKQDDFEKEFADIIRYKDKETGQYFYRDAGIVVLEPDGEYISNIQTVADNFGIKYLTIDPKDPRSVGVNPFIGKDPAKVASIISNVLKGMYESEGSSDTNLFFTQVTQQAIENLAILLKVMYPIMHNGDTPTLEDMLECLHDYNIIENMCEELKRDPVMAEDYEILIAYFEKNFYNQPLNDMGAPIIGSTIGSGRKATEKFLYGATTQLDNLLRQPDVNRLLCSRDNNIDFDKALEEGTCITACSRRGALSALLSKAFGMFFILSFQDAVLRRPGNENTRTPFFFYIDEFPDFVNKETETCFTLFRKYRCGMIVAIQNLSQLERTRSMAYYKKVLISNTKTKIVFGNTNLDDSKFWESEMGTKLQWTWKYGKLSEETDGSETVDAHAANETRFFYFSIAGLPFKHVVYKTLNIEGKEDVDEGVTDFLDERFYKQYPVKTFDFTRYLPEDDGKKHDTLHPAYDYSNIVEPEVLKGKDNYEFKESKAELKNSSLDNLDYLNVENYSDKKVNKLSDDEIEALSNMMYETAMGGGIIPTESEDSSDYVQIPDIDPNAIKEKGNK